MLTTQEATMTPDEAYTLLRTRWPGRSFCIGFDLWHHDHDSSGAPPHRTDEWTIYHADQRHHYRGATLEAAMEQALGCDADVLATP